MTGHSHENMAPPAAIKAAGVLILLSLALVTAVRAGWWDAGPTASVARVEARLAPNAERLLHFRDRTDGFVVVIDATSGTQVAALGREGSGFVRGVMRGLARERRMHGDTADAPFRLAAWPDGALSLTDTATGRVIELGGFGPDNRAAFARFLSAAPVRP